VKKLLKLKKGKNKTIHHKELGRRTADRIKAVLLTDYRQIAKVLFLDEDTINNHVNEYMKNKKLSIQSSISESKLLNTQKLRNKRIHQEKLYIIGLHFLRIAQI
jgi:DNA-binding NarL/FixJ family response regulator